MSTWFGRVRVSVSSMTGARAFVRRASALCAAVLIAAACTQPWQQFQAGELLTLRNDSAQDRPGVKALATQRFHHQDQGDTECCHRKPGVNGL
ncbi:hypothetical protein P3T23_009818 [Paraburkholderia sp. GAS448]